MNVNHVSWSQMRSRLEKALRHDFVRSGGLDNDQAPTSKQHTHTHVFNVFLNVVLVTSCRPTPTTIVVDTLVESQVDNCEPPMQQNSVSAGRHEKTPYNGNDIFWGARAPRNSCRIQLLTDGRRTRTKTRAISQ